MDETMKQFQKKLVELEEEAERLLLARHQVIQIEGDANAKTDKHKKDKSKIKTSFSHYIKNKNSLKEKLIENDRLRNGNREALTALRKRAQTTKSSVPSPFESIMNGVAGTCSRPLVQEVCTTCSNHDCSEQTWMMFPGTDVFARIPFHAAHTILEADQAQLDFEAKRLQSFVKEKSYLISETGALADKISTGVLKSLVTLNDKPK